MDKKIYKNLVAVVRTIDPKTEVVESEVTKNIDSKERRDWLQATVMWGLFNNKIVEVMNKEDDKE